jgi:hypothetical protein
MTRDLLGLYDIQGYYWDPAVVTRQEYRCERDEMMKKERMATYSQSEQADHRNTKRQQKVLLLIFERLIISQFEMFLAQNQEPRWDKKEYFL